MQEITSGDSYVRFENDSNCLYLRRIASSPKGQGDGTKLMREVFKRSLEKGFEGRVELQAIYQSHIFHLKMGFLPKDREIQVAEFVHGQQGFNALKQIEVLFPVIGSALKEGRVLLLSKSERKIAKRLKSILKFEMKKVYPKAKNITDEQLLAEKEFLLGLRSRTGSFVQLKFIPQMIRVMESIMQTGKLPDADVDLGSANMYLSQEGMVVDQEGGFSGAGR